MEAALRLREASFVVSQLARSMKRCTSAEEISLLLKNEGWLPGQGERMSDVVRRKIPDLDELTVREIAKDVGRVALSHNTAVTSAKNFRLRGNEFNEAIRAETPTGEEGLEIVMARERYRAASAQADAAVKAFLDLVPEVERLSEGLKARAEQFERKLIGARREIEGYFNDI